VVDDDAGSTVSTRIAIDTMTVSRCHADIGVFAVSI